MPPKPEDEIEMESYNQEPREQLGGCLTLKDIAEAKMKNYVVKSIVFKSMTLKSLKAIDDDKKNQISNVAVNSPNFDPQKYIEKAKKICCKSSDMKEEMDFDASSKN
jgi:predicted metalloprotease with PDZ domain